MTGELDAVSAIEAAILRRCGTSYRSTRRMLFAIEEQAEGLPLSDAGRLALMRIAARLRSNLERLDPPREGRE